jgi:hypothetical protein
MQGGFPRRRGNIHKLFTVTEAVFLALLGRGNGFFSIFFKNPPNVYTKTETKGWDGTIGGGMF